MRKTALFVAAVIVSAAVPAFAHHAFSAEFDQSKPVKVSGEISRELQGARIAHSGVDDAFLIPDYPLLPSRRRFWEAALRALDTGGKAGQLEIESESAAVRRCAGR